MKRAEEAEEKLKLLTLVKEKRIANLEGRISELSEMIGNYDKTRQQDLITIQKLKVCIFVTTHYTNFLNNNDNIPLYKKLFRILKLFST